MRTPFPHNKEKPQLEGRPRSGDAGHGGADVIDVSHTGAGLTGRPSWEQSSSDSAAGRAVF